MLIGAGSDSHGPGVPVDPRPWRAIWAKDLLTHLGIEVGLAPDERGLGTRHGSAGCQAS